MGGLGYPLCHERTCNYLICRRWNSRKSVGVDGDGVQIMSNNYPY